MMNVPLLVFDLPRISIRVSLSLAAVLIAATAFASWMTPKLVEVTDAVDLEATVPRAFGDWKELPTPFAQVTLATGTEPDMDQPYDQTVMRTYVNGQGQHVMLALAWGRRQRQEVKIHRPDLCYVAQGFQVKTLAPVRFDAIAPLSGGSVVGKHMLAGAPRYQEAVSYWIRIGTLFSEDAVDTRLHILREGLKGRVPDGILVRASMRVSSEEDLAATWPLLDSFLADLVTAVPDSARQMLLGHANVSTG
jgi:EpsI family protein